MQSSTTEKVPKFVEPYLSLGLDLTVREAGSSGLCPFCSERKFSVKNETGQFICGGCKCKGNAHSFCKFLWENSAEEGDALDELAAAREVKVSTLKRFGARISLLTGKPILPLHNGDGTLVNLLRVETITKDGQPKIRPFAVTGLTTWPYGLQHLTEQIKTVWLVEGPWKVHSWWEVLSGLRDVGDGTYRRTANPANSLAATTAVVGILGVRAFKSDWGKLFGDRDIITAFDNDHPDKEGKLDGYEWSMKTASKLQGKGTRQVLVWGKEGYLADRADGFDLRDLRRQCGDSQAVTVAFDMLQKPTQSSPKKAATPGASSKPAKEETPPIEPIECTSFEQLCEVYAESLYFPKIFRQTLAISLAVVVSTAAPNNHLWLRIIGPPSVGKSVIAEALTTAREWCRAFSMTTGFHSGYIDPSSRGTDNSVIPQMNNMTNICKDADTMIQNPAMKRIMSELRDIYDGVSRAQFRTSAEVKEYNDLKLTFILCGTDILRSMNDTMLGERFLDCEIYDEAHEDEYAKIATKNEWDVMERTFGTTEEVLLPSQMMKINQYTYGYIKYLKERCRGGLPFPSADQATKDRVEAMGKLLAYGRARQYSDEEATFRVRKEGPPRLAKQFVRLTATVGLILNKSTVDAEVVEHSMKVLNDTARGYHYSILTYLAKHMSSSDDCGQSYQQIAYDLGIPDSMVRRVVKELQSFQVVERNDRNNNSGVGGRNSHNWIVTPKIAELYEMVYQPRAKGKAIVNGLRTKLRPRS